MATTTQHLLIFGRVQGVGFRNYTLEMAMVDNLCGWVRNLKDGRVEALVQGSPDQLAAFVEQLKKGPSPIARVANIEIETHELEEEFKDFKVTEDGDEPWSSF